MHFENEKLDSIEADKEFEITLRSMLAQDEAGTSARIFGGEFSASLKRAIPSRNIRISWDMTVLTVRL